MELEFTVGNAFNEGWRVMKANYGSLLGAALVYLVISLVMGFVPIVGPLANLFIAGPLLAGWSFMGVRAYRERTEFSHLWDGFSRFGKTLGIYWLTFLVSLAALIPAGICVGLAYSMDKNFEGPGIAIAALGAVVSLVIFLVVLTRFSFAMVIGMDSELGAVDSMRKSWEITKPCIGTIIGLFVCVGLVCMLLAVLLYLPLIFLGMPWSVCITGAAYCLITRGEDVANLERVYE